MWNGEKGLIFLMEAAKPIMDLNFQLPACQKFNNEITVLNVKSVNNADLINPSWNRLSGSGLCQLLYLGTVKEYMSSFAVNFAWAPSLEIHSVRKPTKLKKKKKKFLIISQKVC